MAADCGARKTYWYAQIACLFLKVLSETPQWLDRCSITEIALGFIESGDLTAQLGLARATLDLLRKDAPFVIRGGTEHWAATRKAREGRLLDYMRDSFGDVELSVSSPLLYSVIGPNTIHRNTSTLKQEILHIQEGQQRFIFDVESQAAYSMLSAGQYELPSPAKPMEQMSVFTLGTDGSGLSFNVNGGSMLGLAMGSKRWFMTRPEGMGEELLLASWNMTDFANSVDRDANTIHGVHSCVQNAGDLLFVPPHWWHATLNVGVAIGFGGQFSVFRASASLNTNAVSFREFRGKKLIADKNVEEGVEYLQDVLKELPSRLENLAALLMGLGTTERVAVQAVLRRVFHHLEGLTGKVRLSSAAIAPLFTDVGYFATSVNEHGWAFKFHAAALKRDPTLLSAWYHSALAVLKFHEETSNATKGRQLAIKRLRKALQLDPSHSPSQDALDQLTDESVEL